jgi:hypothetical protein
MGMKSPPWIKHLYGTMAFLYSSFVSRKGQDTPIGPMKEALDISYTIVSAKMKLLIHLSRYMPTHSTADSCVFDKRTTGSSIPI